MLDRRSRAPSTAASKAARRRAQHRRWQANYRRRLREGAKVTEVPASMIELLILTNDLAAEHADDPRAISIALHAMAREARKNFL